MTGCVWWGKGCRGAGFPAPWKPDGVPSKLDGVLSGVDGVPWRLDGVHSEVGGVHSKLDGVPSNVDGAHSKADGTPWKSDGVPWTVDGVPCGMERSRPQKSRRRGTAAGKCWKKPGTVPLPEPWSRGAVEPWSRGAVEPWSRGAVEPWSRGANEIGGEHRVRSIQKRRVCNDYFLFFQSLPRGSGIGSLSFRYSSGGAGVEVVYLTGS